jgi:molecular chaperone GrpE
MTHHHRRTRAEERIAELDASPKALASELDELRQQLTATEQQLAASEQELAEAKQGWQRTAADFANYRRRTDQDREQMLGLANEMLLIKLLAIVDDFDRAVANMPPELQPVGWVEGIVAIDRKLRLLLDSEGLTPIEAVGQPFNPHDHEAAVREERTDVPDGTVVAELQRGYRIRDRVLRPAMVVVAKHPDNDIDNSTTDFGGIN